MNEMIQNILSAWQTASRKFPDECIDVVWDEDSHDIYVMYHDRHNSCPVSDCCVNTDRLENTEAFFGALKASLKEKDIPYCLN